MVLIPEPPDLIALNTLRLDPDATFYFDYLKCCLMWTDERPAIALSEAGRELLTDLWIVRGFLHRVEPRENWGYDPDYFAAAWQYGLANVPQWPGFQRLVLSDADQKTLEQCIATPFD